MSILRAEKIVQKFGGLVAVNDVDFALEEGEIVGIIGPNGAGKTTFLTCSPASTSPHRGGCTITTRTSPG